MATFMGYVHLQQCDTIHHLAGRSLINATLLTADIIRQPRENPAANSWVMH